MSSVVRKAIDIAVFGLGLLLGGLYFFYSIATKDSILLLVTAAVYLGGFVSRRFILKSKYPKLYEVAFLYMSAMISQAIVVLINKGERLDLIDNYIAVNAVLLTIITVTTYLLARKFNETPAKTKSIVMFIYVVILITLLQPLGDFIMQHESLAFFFVGSPLIYIASLNFGIVKAHLS